MKNNIKRMYHHYKKWEDAKAGMYKNPKDIRKESIIICNYFRDSEKVEESMLNVINNWKYSCEQNLSNPSMNKIAYLGQSSVTFLYGFSRESTMVAWNFLDEFTQNKANKIAESVLKEWGERYA